MGNTDKNKAKKCRRKIRIRLADPNIPDSYVCEVLDSSVENEEDISKKDDTEYKNNGDSIKPKNYFELLMGQKQKKSSHQSSEIYGITELDLLNAQKSIKKDDDRIIINLSNEEDDIRVNCQTDSSDEESLLVIKNKVKQKTSNGTAGDKKAVVLSKNKNEINNKNLFSIFDVTKSEISQKKSLGILNYFSKTETSVKNEVQVPKSTAKKSSLKNCLGNNSKNIKNQSESKVSLNGINKENVKLAPVFCKKETKVVDSAKQKARLEFLYKGLPMAVKKTENKACENLIYFPVVSHVQQRNDSPYWSLRNVFLPLSKILCLEENEFNSKKIFRLSISQINNVKDARVSPEVKINKEYLCKIKCKYSGQNIDLIIDGLKEKQDKFLSRATVLKKNISKSQLNSNDKTGFEELNLLYTEKYKPKSSEILGNGNVVKKLRNWLLAWKSFDQELKFLAKSNKSSKLRNECDEKRFDDSNDDDFLYSGNENYGLKAPENICVISGPVGCGKTALVHALANELEFGVLELNSSSKRTGKKVFSDLQEATQSHKVHRVNLLQTDVPQNTTKKRGRKKKKYKAEKLVEQSNDSKISLILIEDAEIVFEEHDEGFFPAIATLVQTSKRPLIFLTNEPNCHYLYNFKTGQFLLLKMETPNFYNSCAVLDIVSSLEGASSSKEFVETIVRENNFDLRKSLLQLQFWLGSQKTINIQKQFDLGHYWWGLSKFLFKKDLKHFVRPKTRKRKRVNDLFDSSDDDVETAAKKFKSDTENFKNCLTVNSEVNIKKWDPMMNSFFEVLNEAAILDMFSISESQEPVPEIEYKPRDGLSLDENMAESCWSREYLTEQLSNELVSLSTKVFSEKLKKIEKNEREFNFISPGWDELRWRKSQEKASEELSRIVSLNTEKRSLRLDYLPILRNICRTERNRIRVNPKRKNRFYHYLNNLGLELTDENLDLNCDVFDR